MKISIKIASILVLSSLSMICFADGKDRKCGKYENRQLYQGEKGGCFYKTKKGGKMQKVYVDKSKCNC
jgi:hypothetical protein